MKYRSLPFHVRTLKFQLELRQGRNARYSLRAFATHLQMHPSALSRILAGKQDLSLPAAVECMKVLGLQGDEARLFIASVAEDKRNRAAIALSRAIEPRFLESVEIDPRWEDLVSTDAIPVATDIIALEADLVSVMDLEGRFIHVNEALARWCNSIPCYFIGRTWQETVCMGDLAESLAKQERVTFESGREKYFEVDLPSDNRSCPMERKITPVRGADGSIRAVMSNFRAVAREKIVLSAILKIHESNGLEATRVNLISALVPSFADACLFEGSAVTIGLDDLKLESSDLSKRLAPSGLEASADARELTLHDPALSALLNQGGLSRAYALPLMHQSERYGTVLTFLKNSRKPYSDADFLDLQKICASGAQALKNCVS